MSHPRDAGVPLTANICDLLPDRALWADVGADFPDARNGGVIMSQSLSAPLDSLLFKGQLAAVGDVNRWQFLLELAEYTVRGEVSESQAAALCDMLGLGAADHAAAVERARGVN